MSKVKLISECFIRPQSEVDESKRYHYLGSQDLRCLSYPYSQFGQLFRKPDDYMPSSFFENIKHSLSLALVHFYSLAGLFVTERFEDEHSCRILIDCKKGPGAKLMYAAASHLTIADIVSPDTDVPLVVRSFFDMGERAIGHDGHTTPLLSVQVTELADGVFLGYSTNHSALDGTSASHFLTVWSEICHGSSISRIPIYDYKLPVPDGYDPIIKLPYLEPDEFIHRNDVGQLRDRVFHIPCTSMAMLKAKANEEAKSFTTATKGGGTHNITSYNALSALVWRSITRARKLASDERTTCTIAANLRPRLKPPLSENCVGNIVRPIRVIIKVSELLKNNLGWAAMLLCHEVEALDEKATRNIFLKAFTEGGPELSLPAMRSFGPNTVAMGASPRMDMYAPEFGLGRAVAVRTGLGTKSDGNVFSMMGCDAQGSVELHVSLAPQTMAAFLLDHEFIPFTNP